MSITWIDILPCDIKKMILFKLDMKNFMKHSEKFSKQFNIKIDSHYAKLFMEHYTLQNYNDIKQDSVYIKNLIDLILTKIVICNPDDTFNNVEDANRLKNCHAVLNIYNIGQLKKIKKICDKEKIDIYWIEFSDSFNYPINNLIPNVNTLIFGGDFNQKLYYDENKKKSIIPTTVKYLKFGYDFNKKIENKQEKISYLPQNLEELYMNRGFNKNADFLPKNIRILAFNNKYIDNTY